MSMTAIVSATLLACLCPMSEAFSLERASGGTGVRRLFHPTYSANNRESAQPRNLWQFKQTVPATRPRALEPARKPNTVRSSGRVHSANRYSLVRQAPNSVRANPQPRYQPFRPTPYSRSSLQSQRLQQRDRYRMTITVTALPSNPNRPSPYYKPSLPLRRQRPPQSIPYSKPDQFAPFREQIQPATRFMGARDSTVGNVREYRVTTGRGLQGNPTKSSGFGDVYVIKEVKSASEASPNNPAPRTTKTMALVTTNNHIPALVRDITSNNVFGQNTMNNQAQILGPDTITKQGAFREPMWIPEIISNQEPVFQHPLTAPAATNNKASVDVLATTKNPTEIAMQNNPNTPVVPTNKKVTPTVSDNTSLPQVTRNSQVQQAVPMVAQAPASVEGKAKTGSAASALSAASAATPAMSANSTTQAMSANSATPAKSATTVRANVSPFDQYMNEALAELELPPAILARFKVGGMPLSPQFKHNTAPGRLHYPGSTYPISTSVTTADSHVGTQGQTSFSRSQINRLLNMQMAEAMDLPVYMGLM